MPELHEKLRDIYDEVLERNPGANSRLIEASVTGKGPSIREALKFLVTDGHAAIELWRRTWQIAYPEIDFNERLDWWRERLRRPRVARGDRTFVGCGPFPRDPLVRSSQRTRDRSARARDRPRCVDLAVRRRCHQQHGCGVRA